MKKQFSLALAILMSLSLVACGRSSNVHTESAGTTATSAASGVLIPAGTTFYGRLETRINSKTSHDGDKFQITQTDTLFHKSPELRGAVINGHLEGVQPAGFAKKPAMTLVFDNILMPDGRSAPINVRLMNLGAFDAKSHKLRTIGMMIGGGIAGHMIANHQGKRHGGLAGAASGYILSQEMKTDIDVKPGTILELRFQSDIPTPSQ